MIFDDNTTVNLVSQQWKTYGTSGNDTIGGVGSNISMQDDIIYGLDGNDTISGGSGNDYLDGGAGDDTLEGSAGNDNYYYSSGHDVFKDFATGTSSDIIRIAPGITLVDVTFERHVSDGLSHGLIIIDGNNSILIEGHTGTSSGYVIETLIFDDNTTVNLVSQQWKTYGTSGNDTIGGVGSNISMQDDIIYGLDGNDTISGGSGNDYLDGGAGNDTLNGSSGDDTYIFTSGLDTVYDTGGSSGDMLRIGGGVTINDILTSVSGNNAKIIINAGVDELTITSQHSSSTYRVERVEFDDGFSTTLNDHNTWTRELPRAIR